MHPKHLSQCIHLITLTKKSKYMLIKVRNLKYSNAFSVAFNVGANYATELSIAITGQCYGHVDTPDGAVTSGQEWELTKNYH